MGTLSLPNPKSVPAKNWESCLASSPIKQEEEERDDGFVFGTQPLPVDFEATSGDTLPHDQEEEEQLLDPVKEEKADDFLDASSSIQTNLALKAKNGDAFLVTEEMKRIEEQLEEARVKAEEEKEARKRAEADPRARYGKFDDLVTRMQLFSKFLLDNMDQTAYEGLQTQAEEPQVEEKEKGCGQKRKASAVPQYNDRKAKTAVAPMLTRSREDCVGDNCTLSEDEKWEKEQANLVPLLTGVKLNPYQINGVKWLLSVWQNGLHGILADQMGLGKSIQAIGFLAHLKGKGMHGPFLIIAPLSTLSNWVNEISRFTPSLGSIIYHGDKVARAEIRRKFMPRNIGTDFPIVVTSYEVAMSDATFLAHYKWMYVVVDEGHRLKNSNSKLLKEINCISIYNKLLLTGKPLPNNPAELWSLLNFICPGIFSSHQEFESWFDFSGKGNEEQQEEVEEKRRVRVSKLQAILRPMFLRRMKEDIEQISSTKERDNHLCEHDRTSEANPESLVLQRPDIKLKLHNQLIQLRKNCNHPILLETPIESTGSYPPVEKLLEQCGKFHLFDRLLNYLLEQKHKVLVFSQWTKMLDIIEYYLDSKGLDVCRIDGNVRLEDRRKQIAEFNDLQSSLNVFLLSTRPGGLDINLTSADTFIHYDSDDWMNLQATDRCHRMGQTRPLHVYRLATSHSIEGRIMKRAPGKLKPEHAKKGEGQSEQDRTNPTALDEQEEELVALLRDERERMIQTDISEENLVKLMDRSDLSGPPGAANAAPLLPPKGPGWEVVFAGGVLTTS